MASILAQRASAGVQGARATRSVRKQSLSRRMICRAEEKSITKVDRSKDTLFIGASEASISYLDGTLPGDFGFDPLGLADPAVGDVGVVNYSWLKYSEVIHCRFAMLGAAGCIGPEILGKMGLIPESTALVWWKSGVFPPAGTYDNYWTDPWSLFFVEVILMQFAELRRLQDYRNPGSMGKQYFLGLEAALKGSGDPAYPGGPFFNLFNLGKTEAEMKVLKTKEIRNGRLAMISCFGYGAQAVLTGDGPFQNLLDHLSDPVGNNILTNFGKIIS